MEEWKGQTGPEQAQCSYIKCYQPMEGRKNDKEGTFQSCYGLWREELMSGGVAGAEVHT